jgi:adenylate kinase family enzyme
VLSRHGLAVDLAIELIVAPTDLARRIRSQEHESANALRTHLVAYERNIKTIRSFYREMEDYVQVPSNAPIEQVAETVYRESCRAKMRRCDRAKLT